MSWYKEVFGDDEQAKVEASEPWWGFGKAITKLLNRRRARAERIESKDAELRRRTRVLGYYEPLPPYTEMPKKQAEDRRIYEEGLRLANVQQMKDAYRGK